MNSKKDMLNALHALPSGEFPNLMIVHKPWEEQNYQVKYTDLYMGLENPALKKGEPLISLWVNVASIPCCEMTEAGITAEDEAGELELAIAEDTELGFPIRRWTVCRDTVGSVALTYRFYPRVVPPDYRFRPYYDFRNEMNGVTSGGVASLAVPREQKYHIHIDWDFEQMPEDTEAVSVKGEGAYDYVGIPQDYQFTMYAFGKVQKRSFFDGQVKVYWLAEPLPDEERVLQALPEIYKGLAEFFEDADAPYSIFFRKDPFKMSNGATAFEGGFVYGYSDEKTLNRDMALDIFAHEVIHTWPHIEDKQGEGTWYHEGTAELYNILIPYRRGITNLDFVAHQINLRSMNYYGNQFIETPNTEAWPLYWTEREAQWLPYGRGFFYFADTDFRLRKASGGRKCLDDLILEVEHLRRAGAGENGADGASVCVNCQTWEQLIRRELGEEGVAHFRAVMNGAVIEPDEAWFDGAFEISKGSYTDPVRGTVKDDIYIWKRRSDRQNANI